MASPSISGTNFPRDPRGLSHASSLRDEDAAGASKGLLAGAWVAQAIFVAAKLGIADLLREGPTTVADLATLSETHASSLHRLLRALASIGIIAADTEDHFALSPLTEPPRSDVPGSI